MLVTAINGCSRLEVTFLENLLFSSISRMNNNFKERLDLKYAYNN